MEKQAIREQIWDTLEKEGIARFPYPPHDRIPNFVGANAAVERFVASPLWEAASTIKVNPDAPQLPFRRRALQDNKTLYVAVPRLRERACFLHLDPTAIDDIDAATTVRGISEYGSAVEPDAVEAIDCVIAGSVAVDKAGVRIGKGEGYSDLEWGLLAEFDKVDGTTPTVTTVHDRQVLPEGLPTDAHDVPLDHIFTPTQTINTDPAPKPTGIDWSRLGADRIEAIPILRALRDS